MPINYIRVQTAENWLELKQEKTNLWVLDDVQVLLNGQDEMIDVQVTAQTTALNRIQIGWINPLPNHANIMGDDFERAYGDLAFAKTDFERLFHWYFCASRNENSHCYGVKTRPNALCAWTVCEQSIDLWLDIRNGSQSLALNGRTLQTCTVVIKDYQTSSYDAVSDFCQQLASQKNVFDEPVIGLSLIHI